MQTGEQTPSGTEPAVTEPSQPSDPEPVPPPAQDDGSAGPAEGDEGNPKPETPADSRPEPENSAPENSSAAPEQTGNHSSELNETPAEDPDTPAETGSTPDEPGSVPAETGGTPDEPGSVPAEPGAPSADDPSGTPGDTLDDAEPAEERKICTLSLEEPKKTITAEDDFAVQMIVPSGEEYGLTAVSPKKFTLSLTREEEKAKEYEAERKGEEYVRSFLLEAGTYEIRAISGKGEIQLKVLEKEPYETWLAEREAGNPGEKTQDPENGEDASVPDAEADAGDEEDGVDTEDELAPGEKPDGGDNPDAAPTDDVNPEENDDAKDSENPDAEAPENPDAEAPENPDAEVPENPDEAKDGEVSGEKDSELTPEEETTGTEEEETGTEEDEEVPVAYLEADHFEESGDGYTILVYFDDHVFPEGTVMNVQEIRQGMDGYSNLVRGAEEAIADDWTKTGSYQRFFDISFVNGEERIQPEESAVEVLILLDDVASIAPEEDIHVLHFDDQFNAEPVNAETTGSGENPEGVSFSADSFSTYAVTTTVSITKQIRAYGRNYYVTVEYGESADIPKDAKLIATEIGENDERYPLLQEKAAKALDADSVEFPGLYEISIVDKNDQTHRYQPSTDVKVSIRAGENLDAENLQVIHFEGTAEGTVECRCHSGNHRRDFGPE